jgi:polysaccharide export outer membrane protein
MLKIPITVALLSTFVLLLGCTTTGTTKVSVEDLSRENELDDGGRVLKLVPGDSVEISVEVDGRMEVASHLAGINRLGFVTLPLVGDVEIGGKTIEEARNVVATTYGAYFVNPPVIMINRMDDATDGEWGFVTVTGQVMQPGRIKIASAKGIRLTEVINESGGFGVSAKLSDIQVTRTVDEGRKLRASINYKDIGQQGSAEADVSLFDGDIVYVPQRVF